MSYEKARRLKTGRELKHISRRLLSREPFGRPMNYGLDAIPLLALAGRPFGQDL
jgi:hypothetical protein